MKEDFKAEIMEFLANCGKVKVTFGELLRKFCPAQAPAVDRRMMVERIKRDLTDLEKKGDLYLSHDSVSSTYHYPRFISLAQPLVQPAAGADSPGDGSAAKEQKAPGKPRGKKNFNEEEEIKRLAYLFSDTFRKEIEKTDIPAGWKNFFSRMIWQHTSTLPLIQACIEMLQAGMVFEKNSHKLKHTARQKPPERPALQPGLQDQIAGIVSASEEKGGPLPAESRRGRGSRLIPEDEAEDSVGNHQLDRFMFYLNRDRQELLPPSLWQRALGTILDEVLSNETAFQACVVAFKMGIIWLRNRERLENA
jgi:hypothetical protein